MTIAAPIQEPAGDNGQRYDLMVKANDLDPVKRANEIHAEALAAEAKKASAL